jgi:hypothetical protein
MVEPLCAADQVTGSGFQDTPGQGPMVWVQEALAVWLIMV